MNVMYVTTGKAPEGVSEEKFNADDNLFRGAIISVLVDNLVDTYLQRKTGKDIYEALEAQYGASDAGVELYVMEQFLDYMMVEDRYVVEQTHEVQALAKELENYSKEAPCVLPNKFVAGAIITKLPHSWRDFSTFLKHKRKEFTFDDLIATLDVEEKAREKDTRVKAIASSSSANFVQRGNPNFKNNQNKRKNPSQNAPKATEANGSNKKKRKLRVLAILVAVRITLLQTAWIVKIARLQRQRTWLLARVEEQWGMVISYLQFFQCVLHQSGG
jgi:hypothetical protein